MTNNKNEVSMHRRDSSIQNKHKFATSGPPPQKKGNKQIYKAGTGVKISLKKGFHGFASSTVQRISASNMRKRGHRDGALAIEGRE